MPVSKIFTEQEVQELIDKNSAAPYSQRNAALIMGASYWGLTSSELSNLPLDAVMDKNGEFYRIWVLPDYVSYTGIARELHTSDHVLDFFEQYMEWRIENGHFKCNQSWYRNSDPKSAFFLNDRGEPFAMSLRKKGSSDYQPRSMNEKLKALIKKTGIQGATPSTFRDSWIKMMHDAGCGYNELMAVSGIKSKTTLDRKIRPSAQEMKKVFSDVFSRVKVSK